MLSKNQNAFKSIVHATTKKEISAMSYANVKIVIILKENKNLKGNQTAECFFMELLAKKEKYYQMKHQRPKICIIDAANKVATPM